MIQEIAEIIQQNTEDAVAGAIKIIEYLEEEGLSLEGNGWLDGDPLWQQQEEER